MGVQLGGARGEATPDVEAVMDTVVAPIIYRAPFGPLPATHARVRSLVAACLDGARERASSRIV